MSVVVEQTRPLRVDEVSADSAIPEKFVEIVDGELVETTPPGKSNNRIAFRLESMFSRYCTDHPALDYGGDNEGFLIRRNPDTLLSPCAALFRRRPDLATTWFEFAPEIAVEVLSPSNSSAEMVFKRHAYFEAGTEQFWLVDPAQRRISFYYTDGRVVTATSDETVEGEGIISGMPIRLPELFGDL